MSESRRCGYIAIIGRPNVGKSTLLNRLLGQKLSITSRKPQTTRHSILGVATFGVAQALLIDTPGIHKPRHSGNYKAMNRYMNRTASRAMNDVHGILWVCEASRFTAEDEMIFEQLQKIEVPIILVINKQDRLSDRNEDVPYLKQLEQKKKFLKIISVSAKQGHHMDELKKAMHTILPENPWIYGEDELTDRSTKFVVSEIIREKITRLCSDEIPYAVTVQVDQFEQDLEKPMTRIAATIYVERDSQKSIIIGTGGLLLKKIGEQSRVDLEALVGQQIYLKLWVKVKSGWSDNERLLNDLGYQKDS